jgi:predicted acyl esterase
LYDQTIEAGDLDFFATRGYALVIPDPRGCGKSEGEWNGMYTPQEQKDGHDIIEWIAQQPWCDGNVALIGYSYFGIIQPLIAAQQPPHLKTIMPFGIVENFYNSTYAEGILRDFFHSFYHKNAVHHGVSASEKEYSEEELKRRIEERLQDPDVRSNSFYVKILSCWPPRMNPWFFDILLHPLDGSFYHERSEKNIRDKINVPVNFESYESFTDPELNVPKKVFKIPYIGKIPGFTCPMHYGSEEMLRWYDHWLKGVDTGIMDEPPIKMFIHGVNWYRFENEWPLARTEWTKLYLERYQTLATEFVTEFDTEPDVLVHNPSSIYRINGPEDMPFIKYLTPVLVKPLEITGPVVLTLYASIDREDANLYAKLYDVSPNGEKRPVSTGDLRVSHRALIKDESKPWLPIHDHTKAVFVKPGEINEYVIKMSVIANVFQTGHRIELDIPSMNLSPPAYIGSQYGHIPNSSQITYKIYRDARYPSHITLPVIPDTPEELWVNQSSYF